MRLDVYLKVSRLVKRRTVAKEACANGKITLNGKPGKAGADVAPGDVVSLDYGSRVLTVEVVEVPAGPVPRSAATGLYRVVEDARKGPPDYV
ncbi:MAG: RNA-binding S4 domain-containing protein [Bacillota bacterium]|jgi:ribosomal 50S subunit-recycling heat shock protein|nr:MAG: RNA-binding S4 domain-containing protein [Bacillota bacterium]